MFLADGDLPRKEFAVLRAVESRRSVIPGEHVLHWH